MRAVNKNTIKGEAYLILTAVLWGSCFLFQKKGMDYMGPFTLGALRFLLGSAALVPAILLSSNINKSEVTKTKNEISNKELIKGSLLCGAALFLAASLQQIGIVYTSASKAGFLTAMEMIVVAVFSVIRTKKLPINILAGIVIAVFGMYLLCIKDSSMSIEAGDLIVLISTVFWGFQIEFIDKYSKEVDNIKLSALQFMFCGILSFTFMMIFESPKLSGIIDGLIPILYTAVIEVAVCYTLQIIGQRYVSSVVSAVTLTLESVFAVIFAAAFLKECMTYKEITGCILMFVSVILVQIPIKLKNKLRRDCYVKR